MFQKFSVPSEVVQWVPIDGRSRHVGELRRRIAAFEELVQVSMRSQKLVEDGPVAGSEPLLWADGVEAAGAVGVEGVEIRKGRK